MENTYYGAMLFVYLVCLYVTFDDLWHDHECDLSLMEVCFWLMIAPVSFFLILRHDIKYGIIKT